MFKLQKRVNMINTPQVLNLRKLKKKDLKKKRKKQAVKFNFGEQDQVDLISYSGLAEEATYLQIGDKFVRTLFVSGYPYVASVGWLNMLINFNHNIDISYHIEQVASDSRLDLEGVADFTITVWVSWQQGQNTKQMDISTLTIAKTASI